MSKAVVPAKKEVADAIKVIEDARKAFGSMQRSWFDFAKRLYFIRTQETYLKAKVAETFTDFCEKEYPTVSPSTISKLVTVVERWGETIEGRLKKDEKYLLPAYDSCYLTAIKEKDVPKEDFSRIKKAVLDGRMSFHKLKDELSEFIKKAKVKAKKEIDDSYEKIEEELEKDIQKDLDRGEQEFMEEDEDVEPDLLAMSGDDAEIEEEDDSDDGEEVTIASVHARVEFLLDAVPELKGQLKGMKFSKQLVALANDLDSLRDQIDEFLTKMEEKSDEQAVSKAEKRA